MTDEDLSQVPQFRELIAATHQVDSSINDNIYAFKSVPEHEWNYYRNWYQEKITSQFNSNQTFVKISGFVYQNEYYLAGFSIC